MKRTRTITLTMMAASALTLSACGDDLPPPSDQTSFSTVQECTSAGFLPEACEEQFAQAKKAYLEEAPKFNSLAACQEEYGEAACQPYSQVAGNNNSGGSGFFVPALTGFLIANALNDITDRDSYNRYRNRYPEYYGFNRGYYGLPTGKTGSYSTGSRSFSYGSARSSQSSSTALSTPGRKNFAVTPSGRPSANVRTTTVSRSGFGGRSSSRGGGFSS